MPHFFLYGVISNAISPHICGIICSRYASLSSLQLLRFTPCLPYHVVFLRRTCICLPDWFARYRSIIGGSRYTATLATTVTWYSRFKCWKSNICVISLVRDGVHIPSNPLNQLTITRAFSSRSQGNPTLGFRLELLQRPW